LHSGEVVGLNLPSPFSPPVLALAVSLDKFASGITHPICGFLSDVLGRENMMLMIFSLESLALFGAAPSGTIHTAW
jgi:MFS transporter, OFA family, oxalate/formate antiporter